MDEKCVGHRVIERVLNTLSQVIDLLFYVHRRFIGPWGRGGGVGSTRMKNSYCLIEVTWFYVHHEDVLANPHLSVYT